MKKNMKNIKQCYNVYIDIPSDIGNVKFHIQIFKSYEKIFQYDSDPAKSQQYKYKFSIFNGDIWRSIFEDGFIPTDKYFKLSVNNVNDTKNTFLYKYYFYNDQSKTQQKEIIVYPKDDSVNNKLNFKIPIIKLITTNNPILYWKKSFDLDKDKIKYIIQLYSNNELIRTYDVENEEKDYISHQIVDVDILSQNVYKWRVCAVDSFQQFSNWSQFYYFKRISLLNFNVVVKRANIFDLNCFLHVTDYNQLLRHRVFITNRYSNNNLNYFVRVNSERGLLKQKIHVDRNYTDNNLNYFVHVINNIGLLNCKIKVTNPNFLHFKLKTQKNCYSQLQNRLNVTALNQQLNFSCKIKNNTEPLKFKLSVVNYIDRNQLNQKVNVVYKYFKRLFFKLSIFTSNDIKNKISVYKKYNDQLFFNFHVIRKSIEPFVLKLYDENYNQIKIDNRIKIYDINHNEITPLDKYGMMQPVYPYIQMSSSSSDNSGSSYYSSYSSESLSSISSNSFNVQADVYDKFGNIINDIYDQHGNKIIPYTNSNKINVWIKPQKYIAKYTKYSDCSYSYYFGLDPNPNEQKMFKTTENQIVLFTSSKYSFFYLYIVPICDNKKMFDRYYKQILCINEPPEFCSPPFYLDDQQIDDSTCIFNSLPVFSFYPVKNHDVQQLKYHLKISKNSDFSDSNVDVYLNQSNQIIRYQLKDNQLLKKDGIYYIYLATCDYINGQLKSQVPYNKEIRFYYKSKITDVQFKCSTVYKSKIFLKNRLIIRFASKLFGKIPVYRWRHQEKDTQDLNLKGKLYLFKKEVKKDINYKLNVLSCSNIFFNLKIINYNVDLPKFKVTVGHNYNQNINQKLNVCWLNTSNQTQQYQKDNNLNLHNKLKVICKYNKNLFLHSTVMQFIVDKKNDVRFKTQVWNQLNPPRKNNYLVYFKIPVSKWDYDANLLMFKLNIKPKQIEYIPDVVVSSNIEQFVWQTNYNALFYLQLERQYSTKFDHYQYLINFNQTAKFDDKFKIFYGSTSTKKCQTTIMINLKDDVSYKKSTGKFYFHVFAVSKEGQKSKNITTYCIYYNNRPQPPRIISINQNVICENQTPILSYNSSLYIYWTLVSDQDQFDNINYQLQIAKDNLFNDVIYDKKDIFGNFHFINSQTFYPDLYFIRIRSFDSYQYSDWSQYAKFYINQAPQSPIKLHVKNIFD